MAQRRNRNYTYSDVDSRLRITPSGNVEIKYDEDVIIQSIENILSTVFGEDVRSSIGSRLIALLGRPMDSDTVSDITDTIRENITDFEPRVTIERINVQPEYDRGTYDVSIQMRIRELPRRLNFNRRLRTLGI